MDDNGQFNVFVFVDALGHYLLDINRNIPFSVALPHDSQHTIALVGREGRGKAAREGLEGGGA